MMKKPPKDLEEAVERLAIRNEQLRRHLEGNKSAGSRVASATEGSIEDATERARKYWDKLEGKRSSSIPPQAKVSP